jgi:hypothetical protein
MDSNLLEYSPMKDTNEKYKRRGQNICRSVTHDPSDDIIQKK